MIAADGDTTIPGPGTDSDIVVESDLDDVGHVHSGSPSPLECHSLKFTALSNPEFASSEEPDTRKRNLHNVQIETEGENLWAKVQASSHGWYCAFMLVLRLFDLYNAPTLTIDTIRGSRPLRDHVATVKAYFNNYKIQDRKRQQIDSSKFTAYLISTCWPKMVRRIQSWQAMGFIYIISNHISLETFPAAALRWDRYRPIGPGDQSLMDFLNALDDETKKKLIFDHYTNSDSPLSDLPLIFNNISSSSQVPLFSPNTALEFHKMTIAAFNGFATTFIRLKESSKRMVGID